MGFGDFGLWVLSRGFGDLGLGVEGKEGFQEPGFEGFGFRV